MSVVRIKFNTVFRIRCNSAYACLSREIGENGTPHIHLFIYAKSRIRFSTNKKRFPTAHIDKAYGSVVDNIAYITKTGKWENTDKAETISSRI